MDFRFVETGNSAPLSWPSVNSPSPNSPKRRTHPGMNERSSRFDDDGDLIVVAVNEPVEGHGVQSIRVLFHGPSHKRLLTVQRHRQPIWTPLPVRLGLVGSLARPSGNLTGINLLTNELEAKRL